VGYKVQKDVAEQAAGCERDHGVEGRGLQRCGDCEEDEVGDTEASVSDESPKMFCDKENIRGDIERCKD
jgi:hypothetical protein